MMRMSPIVPRAWPLAAIALLAAAWLALGGVDLLASGMGLVRPDAAVVQTSPPTSNNGAAVGVPDRIAGATASDVGVSGAEGSGRIDALDGVASAAGAADNPEAQPDAAPVREVRVSIGDRMLWLVEGADTLLRAPVAVGMTEPFVFEGRRFDFETPRGRRTVVDKGADPIWTPPDWHYYEKAMKKGLEVVLLEADSDHELADGSHIVVRGDQVGRVNPFGNFAAFTPGVEIIFDGKIFVPPLRTAQRRVPDALGPYKLDMGDGYLIHGTHMYTQATIGSQASHGCVRMHNADLARLYALVPAGTPVVIY